MRKRALTPYGVKVKKKLLELGLTQKEFCCIHNISETRFSEILYGVLPGKKYTEIITRELKISVSAHKKDHDV